MMKVQKTLPGPDGLALEARQRPVFVHSGPGSGVPNVQAQPWPGPLIPDVTFRCGLIQGMCWLVSAPSAGSPGPKAPGVVLRSA